MKINKKPQDNFFVLNLLPGPLFKQESSGYKTLFFVEHPSLQGVTYKMCNYRQLWSSWNLKPGSDHSAHGRGPQNLLFVFSVPASCTANFICMYLVRKLIIVYHKDIIHFLLPLNPRALRSELARNFKWQVARIYFSKINHIPQIQ